MEEKAVPARSQLNMSTSRQHDMLFNDERYHRRVAASGHRFFRYDHYAVGRLVGTVAGVVVDRLLDCGHDAPFGGVDLVRPREAMGTVVGLVESAVAHAAKEGIRAVRLRARPHYFGENESAVEFALLNLGARVESSELSLGVRTGRYRAPEDYLPSLGDSARNMVRQALRVDMAFEPASAATEWRACFDLIAEAKRRRAATMKFSFEHLMELRELFGPRIAMHRVVHGNELASAALVYRIAPQWDYVVGWGDDLRYRRNRVMNLTAYHLVRSAISRGVSVLDMGISSVSGRPDDNLIQFKRSIGAVAGLRTNYFVALGGPARGRMATESRLRGDAHSLERTRVLEQQGAVAFDRLCRASG